MRKINLYKILILLSFCLSGCDLIQTPHTHKWVAISDTATCESDGIITYKCSYCGETKEETSEKGHKYGDDEICSVCNKYKYNFVVNDELPKEVGYTKYSGGYYTKGELLEISFLTSFNYLAVKGKIKKTYDYEGENGTNYLCFKIKFVNQNNEVLGIGSVICSSIAVGQTFNFREFSLLNKNNLNLDENDTYYVTFLDY